MICITRTRWKQEVEKRRRRPVLSLASGSSGLPSQDIHKHASLSLLRRTGDPFSTAADSSSSSLLFRLFFPSDYSLLPERLAGAASRQGRLATGTICEATLLTRSSRISRKCCHEVLTRVSISDKLVLVIRCRRKHQGHEYTLFGYSFKGKRSS